MCLLSVKAECGKSGAHQRLLPFCLRPHSPYDIRNAMHPPSSSLALSRIRPPAPRRVPNPSRAPTTTDPLALAWQPLLSGPNARGPEVVPPS
ncbi:hypothetical protein C8Q80DRAFT_1139933 [Daedaleopsis nitida]|nr:hypothetical protein C8Q80DRAFT_1139933 [Daedaleopsis nitida]